jgi:hypothetical protein
MSRILHHLGKRFNVRHLHSSLDNLTDISPLASTTTIQRNLNDAELSRLKILFTEKNYDDALSLLSGGKANTLKRYAELTNISTKQLARELKLVHTNVKIMNHTEKTLLDRAVFRKFFSSDVALDKLFAAKTVSQLEELSSNLYLTHYLKRDNKMLQLSQNVPKQGHLVKTIFGSVYCPVLVVGGGLSIAKIVEYAKAFISENTGCFLITVTDDGDISTCKLSSQSCAYPKSSNICNQLANIHARCKQSDIKDNCKNCACAQNRIDEIQCQTNQRIECIEATTGDALTAAIGQFVSNLTQGVEETVSGVTKLLTFVYKNYLYMFLIIVLLYFTPTLVSLMLQYFRGWKNKLYIKE